MTYIESGLNTSLNCQTRNDIVLSQNGDVEIINIHSVSTFNTTLCCTPLGTFHRVKETTLNSEILGNSILCLNTCYEACLGLLIFSFTSNCRQIKTDLRHKGNLTNLVLCVCTQGSYHHGSNHHNLLHNFLSFLTLKVNNNVLRCKDTN